MFPDVPMSVFLSSRRASCGCFMQTAPSRSCFASFSVRGYEERGVVWTGRALGPGFSCTEQLEQPARTSSTSQRSLSRSPQEQTRENTMCTGGDVRATCVIKLLAALHTPKCQTLQTYAPWLSLPLFSLWDSCSPTQHAFATKQPPC